MSKISEKFSQINNNSIITKIARALLVLLPLPFIVPELDNDFWFQINSGRSIVSLWPNGFLTIEPFTVHEGFSFSFQKWLTDVLFYEIYEHAGNMGIYLLLLAIGLILSFVLYKTCSLVSGNKSVSAIISAVSLVFFTRGFLRTRPQIFAYIFLVLEIYVLEKYTKEQRPKILIWIPLLSFAYMQFHSTMWPMFLIFMLPYIFEFGCFNNMKALIKAGFVSGMYKKLPICLAFVLSIATALINPYGFDSIIYLCRSSIGDITQFISELAPADYTILPYIWPPLLLHLLFFFRKNREAIPLRYIFFIIGTLAMMQYASRNAAYYVLAGAVIAAWMFKAPTDKENMIPKTMSYAVPIVMLILLLPASVNLLNLENTAYNSTDGKAASDFLLEYSGKKNQNPGELKVYTGFSGGAYPEWLGFKCYIDPRAEIFAESLNRKEDIISEYCGYLDGEITYAQLQEKYDFDYWILNKTEDVQKYITADDSYTQIYEDEQCLVFEYSGVSEE